MTPFDIVIDIGDAQPSIDGAALADSPVGIVFIKATEGAGFGSKTYDAQLTTVLKAGKLPVPYHFLRPGSADAQVKNFVTFVRPAKNQPFALDWEGRASQTCTPQICEAVGTQLGALTMRKPVGYWGMPGSTPALPTAAMQGWNRWEPRYPLQGDDSWADLPSAIAKGWQHEWPGQPLFAQYTMWGRVPGIPGLVDRSVFFGNSPDDAKAWYATGALPAPAAAPAA